MSWDLLVTNCFDECHLTKQLNGEIPVYQLNPSELKKWPGAIGWSLHLSPCLMGNVLVVYIFRLADVAWSLAGPANKSIVDPYSLLESHSTEPVWVFDRKLSTSTSGCPPTEFLKGSRLRGCTPSARTHLTFARNSSTPFATGAMKVLALGKKGLDAAGVKFWINSGTLLGYYRECNFIGHAKDVDFGIKISDYRAGLVPALERVGLRLSHVFGTLNDSFELSFAGPSGVKLDLFFFYPEETGGMWNGGTQARSGRKFKYSFPASDMCWGILTGFRIRIPCETEPFVMANYGEKWSIPLMKWDWKSSAPNVVENGIWPQDSWSTTVQCDVCKHKVRPKQDFGANYVDLLSTQSK